MNSLFSFAQPSVAPPVTPVAPVAALMPSAAPGANSNLEQMLALMRRYVVGLPSPTIFVTGITERPLAIGNWLAQERRSSFATVVVKGGRLDAGLAFQFMADTSELVDNAAITLQGRLLAASDDLWRAGFLRLTAEESVAAEFAQATNNWRKLVRYRVLYEFQYLDPDGAESIIARIPIHSDPEERDSPVRETTTVTDALVRWDDEGASPLLLAATTGGRLKVKGFASLSYLPIGWIGSPVTLARLSRSATALPTTYPTLAAFQTAITAQNNPDRHAQVIFPSVAQFLHELALDQTQFDPIELGDWDNDGQLDRYQPIAREFKPSLLLTSSDDLLQLTYQDAVLSAKAVLYLRAEAYSI